MSPILRLETLETLSAAVSGPDGQERRLGKGKPAALLVYLASIPGRRASREHLAALLWADAAPDAARQNLRQTLWYLRKRLGDPLFHASDNDVTLAAPVESDRDRFLDLARRGELAEAVASYRDPFVPDFAAPGAAAFEEWADLERRRLRTTFLRCADTHARALMAAGRFTEAQTLARRARDAAPLEQAGWRLLLETLAAGSDLLGAAAEAEHLEVLMAREAFELEPPTRAMLRTVRQLSTSGTATSGTSTATTSTPPVVGTSIAATGPIRRIASPDLIGREAAFSRLLHAWDEARAGHGRTIVIAAPAGIGKSRILCDLQARLRAARTRAVLVRLHPGDRALAGSALASIVEALARLPGAAAIAPGSASVLVALSPNLSSTFPAAEPDTAVGVDSVRRRMLALGDLVRAVTEESPVALLVDDLHWADESSARALVAVLERPEHPRLLTVVAKRPSPSLRAQLAFAERVDLDPLDLGQVGELISRLAALPADPWAADLPAQLLGATGGVPLLLLETLQEAIDDGALAIDDGRWAADAPETLRARWAHGIAIRQRIERLGPDARALLLRLALLGRPQPAAELPDTQRDAAGELERLGLVTADAGMLIVAHDEIGGTVEAMAADDVRRAAHRGLAEWQLGLATDSAALRRAAAHARAAGDRALMVRIWRRFVELRRQRGNRQPSAALVDEFVGELGTTAERRMLEHAVPWRLRRHTRALLGVAGAVALLATALAPMVMRGRGGAAQGPPDVLLGFDLPDGPHELHLRRSEPWDDDLPLMTVPSRLAPPRDVGVRRPGRATIDRAFIRTGSSDLIGEASFADSGGLELVRWRPGTSTVRRIAPAPGDDHIGVLSPDAQLLAWPSARWDRVTDHTRIAVADLRTGQVRRLTTGDDAESSPVWSLQGTRIAFSRRYYASVRPSAVCVSTLDGVSEQCWPQPGRGGSDPVAWTDAFGLILRERDPSSLRRLDVRTGESRPIGTVPGELIMIVRGFGLCLCDGPDGEPRLEVFRIDAPDRRRVVQGPGGIVRVRPWLVQRVPTRAWIEQALIRAPTRRVPLDGSLRLTAGAITASGTAVTPPVARWRSLDPSVAHVDSTGLVEPRRLGRVRVELSLGGWRADTIALEVTREEARRLWRERWEGEWTRRLVPFGDPRPRVLATGDGPRLDLRGDGRRVSGIYGAQPVAWERGLTLEADAWLPLTRLQWQGITLALHRIDDPAWPGDWDHRTGPVPFPVPSRACQVALPAGEGGDAPSRIGPSAMGTTTYVPTPPGLFSGGRVRIRLELLSDGRCALSVDGRRLATTTTALPPGGTIRVVVQGANALGGRMALGAIELWDGVRGGLSEDAPPSPPPTPR